MNQVKRVLICMLVVLIFLNGYYVVKDIKTDIKNAQTIVDKNKEIVQSTQANTKETLERIEQQIRAIERNQEVVRMSILEKINKVSEEVKYMPNKMAYDKFILEQKLKLINASLVNKSISVTGSGVAIKYKGKFYILSAGHLATPIKEGEAQEEIELREYGKKICDLEVVKHAYTTHNGEIFTNGQDLLLLRPKNKLMSPKFYVDIDAQEPITGTEVYIVGDPMGIEDVVSVGRVIKYSGNFMYITDNIYYGNSGGGVYSIDGRLLGIVSHMQPIQPIADVPPYMAFGIVRMKVIQEFMREVD